MTQIFKKSLMMVAMVAAIAAAQVGVTHAQIDDALISGQTIASVDDIVVNDEQAAAYYDPATGDVILSLGIGTKNEAIFGLTGTDFNFANFDQGAGLPGNPAATGNFALLSLLEIGLPPIPSGVFNIGNILPADPSVTDAAAFSAAFPTVAFRFGIDGDFRDDLDFNVIAPIPEPGSLSLLALAGLGVVARRRR